MASSLGKRGRWVAEHLILPLVVAFVGVVGALWATAAYSQTFADWVSPASCSDPKDLIRVPNEEVRIDPANSSPTQAPVEGAQGDWEADRLVDGDTATPWVPQQDTADPSSAIGTDVAFTFSDPTDLALICVVNGQPSGVQEYLNAGKVRQFAVTTDAASDPRVSPLTVLSTETMQSAQALRFNTGSTDGVRLRVVSVFAGLRVVSETVQGRLETQNVAVAEIEFYREP